MAQESHPCVSGRWDSPEHGTVGLSFQCPTILLSCLGAAKCLLIQGRKGSILTAKAAFLHVRHNFVGNMLWKNCQYKILWKCCFSDVFVVRCTLCVRHVQPICAFTAKLEECSVHLQTFTYQIKRYDNFTRTREIVRFSLTFCEECMLCIFFDFLMMIIDGEFFGMILYWQFTP